MLLHDLLRQFDAALDVQSIPNVQILGISEDSRIVKTGDLFIARPGTREDGIKFVADAHARGAVAVVTQKEYASLELPQIAIADPAAASRLANLFHREPGKAVKIIGVTGTNGKTTTTYLLRHLLNRFDKKCGMIGTVEIDDGDGVREATMTTPGPVELAGMLAAMRDNGCAACAMEVSSHALDQQRVGSIEFEAAGFTNLTGDHLDYHGTMERYADAKAKLFASLSRDAVAVVNADDANASRMTRDCDGKLITFGMQASADYRAQDVKVTSLGSSFVLVTPDGRANVQMGLIGRHNVENALCAAALAGETFGLNAHQVAAAFRDAAGAPGRLQAVRAGQAFAVLVDYAHTDDALENVLTALRPLTRGKLRVVFGCGGDRDRTKRPRMARIASQLADALYITSDNPRTENPQAILDEIVAGLPGDNAKPAVVELDRRRAIQQAMDDSTARDVVLIAGKGHENYQIIGTTKHHFDDVEEATRAMRAKKQVSAR